MSYYKSGKGYRLFTKITAICILVVILAGSLVKVTGSGMGCPDWPKCFGHYIPPFDEKDVNWQPNHEYFKDQMVIFNHNLYSANNNISSNETFESSNWILYDKHSYTEYNPFHTFVEYVNRLATVLLGLIALLMLYFSFGIKNKSKLPIIFSVVIIILILFEAWLGRLVVDSVLSPQKISIHLYAAFVIVAIIGLMLALTGKKLSLNTTRKINILMITSFIVLATQITLGTKLREVFDVYKDSLPRENWVNSAGIIFLVHRSFSLAYLTLIIIATYVSKTLLSNTIIKKTFFILFIVVGLEILSGMLMGYFNVPQFLQPVHVFLSGALVLAHSYLASKLYQSS